MNREYSEESGKTTDGKKKPLYSDELPVGMLTHGSGTCMIFVSVLVSKSQITLSPQRVASKTDSPPLCPLCSRCRRRRCRRCGVCFRLSTAQCHEDEVHAG